MLKKNKFRILRKTINRLVEIYNPSSVNTFTDRELEPFPFHLEYTDEK